jgi:hypothetical protein
MSQGLWRLAGIAAVVLGLAAGAGVLYFYNPAQSQIFPPCPFHWLTGLYCPGCGSLRATHLLLHGRVEAAMGMNPLMVLSIPFVAALFLKRDWFRKAWVPWTAFSILVAYGVLRNVPAWPFLVLAPQ